MRGSTIEISRARPWWLDSRKSVSEETGAVHLADLAGVSRAHLFAFLKGDTDITLTRLEQVAGALGVDVVELVRVKA